MVSIEQLREFGEFARAEAEKIAASVRLCSIDEEDLSGACYLASKILAGVLDDHGVPATVAMGGFRNPEDSHCWVLIAGKIIDITVTQFKIPERVFIVDANDPRYIESVRGDIDVDSIAGDWGGFTPQEVASYVAHAILVSRMLTLPSWPKIESSSSISSSSSTVGSTKILSF